jgi:putative oxidoreductase
VFPAPDTYNLSMLLFRVAVSMHLMTAPVDFGAAVGSTPWPAAEVLRLGLAMLTIVLFPAFVIAGLFSRLASLGILSFMLLGSLRLGWMPHQLPYLYGMAYLLLLALGPGKYSADFLINRSLTRW